MQCAHYIVLGLLSGFHTVANTSTHTYGQSCEGTCFDNIFLLWTGGARVDEARLRLEIALHFLNARCVSQVVGMQTI